MPRTEEEIKKALDIVHDELCDGMCCSQGCDMYELYLDCPIWAIKRRLRDLGKIDKRPEPVCCGDCEYYYPDREMCVQGKLGVMVKEFSIGCKNYSPKNK